MDHAIHQGQLQELHQGIDSAKPRPLTHQAAIDADDTTPISEHGWYVDAKGPYRIQGYNGATHDMGMVYRGFIYGTAIKGTNGAAQ